MPIIDSFKKFKSKNLQVAVILILRVPIRSDPILGFEKIDENHADILLVFFVVLEIINDL